MRRRPVRRTVLVGLLLVGAIGACAGDEEEQSSADTTAAESIPMTRGHGPENTLEIEMVDYGYNVKGTLGTGLATITSTNTGEEWHMAGVSKLKAGKTAEELAKALKSTEGPEGQDPTAEFIDQTTQIGGLGHILQPGLTQSLTVDVLDAGSYVMLCYIPTEGDGTPHFARGMVGGFEVENKKSTAQEPHEDATVTLSDDAEPSGAPTEIKAGKQTFKVTTSGTKRKDFIIARVAEGQDVQALDTYFDTVLGAEGGPPKGAAKQAPGTIFGGTLEMAPGQTVWMTAELTAGDMYFVNTTNPDEDDGEGTDKSVKVKVT